jgi:uncharacterized OsmC-like protein
MTYAFRPERVSSHRESRRFLDNPAPDQPAIWEAVEDAFGGEIDDAQLVKLYGAERAGGGAARHGAARRPSRASAARDVSLPDGHNRLPRRRARREDRIAARRCPGHTGSPGIPWSERQDQPGFKQIHLKAYIDSPNSPEEVLELFKYAQARSPICSTVRNNVMIEWKFDVDACDSPPDSGEDRHGVNFPTLAATVEAVKETPVLAKCKFYASAEWLGGAKIKSTHAGFDQAEGERLMHHPEQPAKSSVGDELNALLGAETGPSPSETLLHAMANCVSVTASYHCAARGVPLRAFKVNLDGDMDLQGFADLDDRVTPAYQTIRAKVQLKGGGKENDLAELLEFTSAHSPMCDSVGRPVDASFSLIHNGKAVAKRSAAYRGLHRLRPRFMTRSIANSASASGSGIAPSRIRKLS